jgi:hypothetical protein
MAREFTTGWETGSVAAEGFDGLGLGGASSLLANLHKDGAGNGSAWAVAGTGTNTQATRHRCLNTFRAIKEGWLKIQTQSVGSNGRLNFSIFTGATELAWFRVDGLDGSIQLARGAGTTVIATGAAGTHPIDSNYYTVDIHFRLDDTIGIFDVFIDDPGTYVTPDVTFSGDTKVGADTTWNTIGVGVGGGWRVDEIAVNSITIRYDGGTGTAPVAGQTITGGTSGATAVITTVEGNATSGVLVLQQWNGTSFQNNEALTSPTLSALVDAPSNKFRFGFEPNSWAVGESHVVHLIPNGAGATTQLTPTAGSNFQCVDETPPNTSDYNASAVNDQLDTYAKSSMPASATQVSVVGVYAYASRDGATINNYRNVIRLSGTNYFGTQYALGTSFAGRYHIFNTNPATLDGWDISEVTAAGTEPGFQVRT